MMKNKRAKGITVLFVSALVLLSCSALGSASAALTYYNEDYRAQISASTMDVVIEENGAQTEELLAALGRQEKEKSDVSGNSPAAPGETYTESLTVTNTGSIDVYARVILRRYWRDEKGEKNTALSPDLIELVRSQDNGWVLDQNASTKERLVLYYTDILPASGTTPPFLEGVRISPDVAKAVSVKSLGNGRVETVYDYNGYMFCLEAEVETVQTHNAADAIKSAWGVDVSIDGGKLMPGQTSGSEN